MKKVHFKTICIIALLFSIIGVSSCNSKKAEEGRKQLNFNKNWQFSNQPETNFEKLSSPNITWESIQVPHDWTAITPYNQSYVVTDSTKVPGRIGWYKKEFTLSKNDSNKQISIEFDGVYNNSKVWINGHYLGFWPYGYTAFSYDLSNHLKFNGEPNKLIVKVDRTAFLDSRWYAGAGIYRDVNLLIKNKIHIPKWGLKVTTPKITDVKAAIFIELSVQNTTQEITEISLVTTIKSTDGDVVASAEKKVTLPANNSTFSEIIQLPNPKLWSPDAPNLYTVTTKLVKKNTILDTETTKMGVRSLKYDTDKGFSLNGKNTKFKGVCLHHCAGALGAAVPNDVWLRRLLTLKKGGVNAIRTAHNPASKNFLDMCDSLGFLVQEEIFDELDYPKDKRKNYAQKEGFEDIYSKGYTDYFQQWGERDLESMLLRDQNHPSIIMWSIGNELEWTYPRYGRSSGYWNSDKKYYYDEPPISIAKMKELMGENPPKKYELAKTISRLSNIIKKHDTLRAVTANLVIPTVSHFSGYTDALDIVGYSYRACVYEYGHKNYPKKMIYGSENWASYIEWNSAEKYEYIPGVFLWAGIDYMGETSDVLKRGSNSGLINYAGFPSPRWYMYKSVWNNEPMVYATTYPLRDSDYRLVDKKVAYKKGQEDLWKKRRWGWQSYNTHWNYNNNEITVIEVFTNCPSVELFLNSVSQGTQQLADFEDHLIKFAIPFTKGELKVIGNCNQNPVAYIIKTAKNPIQIRLTTDKNIIRSNTNDVSHITAQLVDDAGNPVLHKDMIINFKIDKDLRFLGIDNGSNILSETSSSTQIKTHNGKALLYVQSGDMAKQTIITAILPNGIKKAIEIEVK